MPRRYVEVGREEFGGIWDRIPSVARFGIANIYDPESDTVYFLVDAGTGRAQAVKPLPWDWWPWSKDVEDLKRRLERIEQKEDKIMSLIDDLRAAQGNTDKTLGLVQTGVAGLATEVNDLIARLPVGGTVTQADVDAANALGAKAQAIADALAAIPAEPAP